MRRALKVNPNMGGVRRNIDLIERCSNSGVGK
jgi:hypothetical protein